MINLLTEHIITDYLPNNYNYKKVKRKRCCDCNHKFFSKWKSGWRWFRL